MKFGEKIKKLRMEKGLSQSAVAKKAGLTIRTYTSYENEGRYPRDRQVYTTLANVFGVDPNYLLTEDEEFVSSVSEKYGPRGQRQAEDLVAELVGIFAGGELSEDDMDAVMLAMQKAYVDCKENNKKYTPKKYRKKVEQ